MDRPAALGLSSGRPPMPAGSHGPVTVRQVDGRWEATVYVRDLDGVTRRVRRSRASGAAARRALNEHLGKRVTPGGQLTPESSLTEAVEGWLDEAGRKGRVRAGTLRVYRTAWKSVSALIGQLRLVEVGAGVLTRALDELNQVSPGQVRNGLVVTRHGLSYAVRAGALVSNPAREVELPPRTRREVRALTVEEETELRRVAREHRALRDEQGRLAPGPRPTALLPDVIEVLLGTGLRIGEALALRWQDVDLDDTPTLRITGTMVEGTGGLRRQEVAKTEAAHRILAIPHAVVAVLERRRHEAKDGVQAVFATRTGRHVSPADLRRLLRAAVNGTELEWVTPHACRRTVATRIEASLGIRAALEQLGHARPAVTEDHYLARNRVHDHRSALEPRP